MCFFFNDSASTEVYTLSLHDALPISPGPAGPGAAEPSGANRLTKVTTAAANTRFARSEEHTSELQSHSDLVCRLLLEKKNTLQTYQPFLYLRRFEAHRDTLPPSCQQP